MAYIVIYFPDNRPFEHKEGQSIVKTNQVKLLVCYDHAEEVLHYLTGMERKLKRLYPKDMKQRNLYETGTFKWRLKYSLNGLTCG